MNAASELCPVEISPCILTCKHVGLDDVDNFLPLLFGQREKVVPLGVLVADKSPVNAGGKVEDVDVGGGKVDEAHPSEPVLLIRLGRIRRCERDAR